MDSMGYEYDYFSIMHYGTRFFSSNGKATIKIRKKGKKIGAQIGQRKSLSWIDVAQVHAMYNCNKIPSEESSKSTGISLILFYDACWSQGLCARLRIERSGFEPWPETLRCVFG